MKHIRIAAYVLSWKIGHSNDEKNKETKLFQKTQLLYLTRLAMIYPNYSIISNSDTV